MKAIFTSEDPVEIRRIAKSDDMANFIWELVVNGWRDFKYTDYDYEPAWKKIRDLLEEHRIDIEDLIS
jgi:hypothetical protein